MFDNNPQISYFDNNPQISYFNNKPQISYFDNDNDSLVPEVWAQESLIQLYDTVVTPTLVHRNFEDEIAMFGDVVNTRRPQRFRMIRKNDMEDVTDQAAVSENVQVRLDQLGHVSFVIKDGEESKSMKHLIEVYLTPAMRAMGEGIEQAVLGERANFLHRTVGSLGNGLVRQSLIDGGVVLDEDGVPMMDRNLVLTPNSYGDLLNIPTFHEVDAAGDGGMALRNGMVGRANGFDIYKNNSNRTIKGGQTTSTTLSSAATEGATTIALTAATNANVGEYLVVSGEGTPQFITGKTGSNVDISPGLSKDVATGSAVTITKGALVNNADGYPSGFHKGIAYDGVTSPIQTTQLLNLNGKGYGTMVSDSNTEVYLNKLVDPAVEDNDLIGLAPKGNYNWLLHPNAVALVTRPLAMPMEGTGARSATAMEDGIGLRVTITYDGKAQGHRVTIDTLFGTQTLDNRLGALILA